MRPDTVVARMRPLITPPGDDAGILKRDGMRRELDPGSFAPQAAVRTALDPLGIFNPGKG